MKTLFWSVILLSIGGVAGGGAVWVSSHVSEKPEINRRIDYETVLRHSAVTISDDRFACVGNAERTVGGVIGSILEFNERNIRNKVRFDCHDVGCFLISDNCMPWQEDSCGGRLLRFKLDENNRVLPDTFECLDVP